MASRSSDIKALQGALDTVQTNGQAIAAADLAYGAVVAARDRYSAWSIDPARRYAHDQLDAAAADIQKWRAPFAGMPSDPVNDTNWDELKHAIERGYDRLWASLDVEGDEPEWKATLSAIGDITTESIKAMPEVIRGVVHFASETVTDTVGGLTAGLLPLWPIVVIAGVVLVVGALALAAGRKRGLVA